MNWRWDWFWSILWNMFLHAVTFQWGELGSDGEDLKDWWRSLWDEITRIVDDVEDWARGQISYWSGYAYGLYVQAIDWVNSSIASVWSGITSSADAIYSWAQSWFDWLSSLAYSVRDEAIAIAQSLVNSVYDWAYPYIDSVKWWVYDQFAWIQSYYDLVVNWLQTVRGGLDWLYWNAIGEIQAFLGDPLNYVLGWLRSPLEYWIGQLQQWGSDIIGFVTEDLADLRNLLATGYSFLMTFIDRPTETILELLVPTFVDWLAGLIADSW